MQTAPLQGTTHTVTHTHTHSYTHTLLHTHTHSHTLLHTHTHTHIHSYTHTFNTHTYTLLHTHTHTVTHADTVMSAKIVFCALNAFQGHDPAARLNVQFNTHVQARTLPRSLAQFETQHWYTEQATAGDVISHMQKTVFLFVFFLNGSLWKCPFFKVNGYILF